MTLSNHVNTVFTSLEQQIIARVTKGLTNRMIGVELGLSTKMVEYHNTKIAKKFNVTGGTRAYFVCLTHYAIATKLTNLLTTDELGFFLDVWLKPEDKENTANKGIDNDAE